MTLPLLKPGNLHMTQSNFFIGPFHRDRNLGAHQSQQLKHLSNNCIFDVLIRPCKGFPKCTEKHLLSVLVVFMTKNL